MSAKDAGSVQKQEIRKQQGVVLWNTIMMIGLFSALIVSQLQWIGLQYQSLNRLKAHRHSLQELESVLARLTNTPTPVEAADASCRLNDALTPDEILILLKAGKGCAYPQGSRQYRYIVEDLGIVPCVQIIHHHIPFATRHWVISVLEEQAPHLFIQVRIAKASEPEPCTLQDRRIVNPGILSWMVF